MKNLEKIQSPTAVNGQDRYRLIVLDGPDADLHLQVIDCERGCQLFEWKGHAARHLLNSRQLDTLTVLRYGCYSCDKNLVCHLALVAAVYQIPGNNVPSAHRLVAETMSTHSSEHITADDAWSYLGAKDGEVDLSSIKSCLTDDDDILFDTATRPRKLGPMNTNSIQ